MPTLDFKGKSFVHSHHLSVPFRELVVCPDKSLSAAGQAPGLDDNLIIHGDNLHALKALLPMYAGKVDCIYIDPPYNTGNEGWCYNDNVRSPLMREWLKKATPVDKEDMERHEKWLCMMWPRLKLLCELLANDGVIFVSIDDEEVGSLLPLMDEVFGEDRRIAIFTWIRKKKGSNLSHEFRKVTEYVLVYRKGEKQIELHGTNAYAEKAVPLINRDNSVTVLNFPAGKILTGRGFPDGKTKRGSKGPDGELQVVLQDDIEVVDKVVQAPFSLEGRFRWSQSFMEEELKNGSEFVLSKDFRVNVYRHDQENKEKAPSSLISPSDGIGTNEDATEELSQIFNGNSTAVFDYPKPVSLIEFLIQSKTHRHPDAIILDSFAGSGTTAHAVLAANKKDGGNRKFILVETEDYADALTAERVRRVIQGYAFTGTQKEELLRRKINWATMKKAAKLVDEVENLEGLQATAYDKVTKYFEDGDLVVTGEKKVKEKTDGLGGSFTFVELGNEMTLDKLLTEGMPSFEALAKYVFYTATGRTLEEVPAPTAKNYGLIGETELYRVHLLYRPEPEWLRSNEAALSEKQVDAMLDKYPKDKRLLVFAVAKFMPQKELGRRGVEFCQLPYSIHRLLGN